MLDYMTRPEFWMTAAPLVLFGIVVELVRRRRLREDYSLLWLATFGLLVILALFPDTLLEALARAMGILYPPTAFFVIGFGLMLIIMIQFSTVISKLARQNQQAAQHIALLTTRLQELEEKIEQG